MRETYCWSKLLRNNRFHNPRKICITSDPVPLVESQLLDNERTRRTAQALVTDDKVSCLPCDMPASCSVGLEERDARSSAIQNRIPRVAAPREAIGGAGNRLSVAQDREQNPI